MCSRIRGGQNWLHSCKAFWMRLIWGQEQRDKVELFVNFRTKVNWTDRKWGWVVQTTICMKIFKTIGHAIKVNLIVIFMPCIMLQIMCCI